MNFGKVRVKFLKDYRGCYNILTPKNTIKILEDWPHKYSRKDWHKKIVQCYGHGEFDVFEPNVDVLILEQVDTDWEFV